MYHLFKSVQKANVLSSCFRFSLELSSVRNHLFRTNNFKFGFFSRKVKKEDLPEEEGMKKETMILEDEAVEPTIKEKEYVEIKFDEELFFSREEKGQEETTANKLSKFINEKLSDVSYSKYNEENIRDVIDVYKAIRALGFSNKWLSKMIVENRLLLLSSTKSVEKIQAITGLLSKTYGLNVKEINEIIASQPKCINIPVQELEKSMNYLKTEFGFNTNELAHLIFKYPVLIQAEEAKSERTYDYLKTYLEMTKEEYKLLVKNNPLVLSVSPFNILAHLKEISRYRLPKGDWVKVLSQNSDVFLMKNTSIRTIFTLLREVGLRADETIKVLIECPDILLSNRHNFLFMKLQLFKDIGMSKYMIKGLIKDYPFVLLKSYNSFLSKIEYFISRGEELKNMSIFPFVLLFNLQTDIIPRFEIFIKNEKNLTVEEAFSLSKEDLMKKIGKDIKEYDSLIPHEVKKERDIMFRYSKF